MKYVLITLALVAGFFVWQTWAAQPWATGITLSHQQNCAGSDCYRFRANNVPYNEGGYAWFWFFDDGSFSMEPMPEHRFLTASSHNVYLELTPLYDKGDKPTRLYINTPISNSTTEIEPETPNRLLTIISNRSPRAGDTITYVLTYGMLCDEQIPPQGLNVSYPPDKLSFIENRHFNGETTFSHDGSTGEIAYGTLSAATDGLAKRIFLTFAVQETLSVSEPVEIAAVLDFRDRGPTCDDGQVSYIQEAVVSHDPNYIEADQETICDMVRPGDQMTYIIHFQNVGNGPAKSVEARSFLPAFFDPASITTIHPASAQFTITAHGELIWTLTETDGTLKAGAPLRGTAEAGFGATFLEEHTKDSVEFSVLFRSDINPPIFFKPCQSIFNQAEIVFDCNPPIRTSFYKTSLNCNEPALQLECECLADSLFTADSLRFDDTPVTVGSGSGQGSVVWYPPAYITDPFALTPDVSPERALVYVGSIGSGQCSRNTEFFQVDIPCDLSITSSVELEECPGGPVTKGNITATANTSYAYEDLMWNWECSDADVSVTGNKLTLSDFPPGVYHITVKNKRNGCWAEVMKIVPATCPGAAPFFLRFIWAVVVVGAVLVILLLWMRHRKGKSSK